MLGPITPFLVSLAALAIGLVVLAWLGRSGRWPAAGVVLIACTPLVPTLRIPQALGLSSDDLLPLIGVATLAIALRRSRDGRHGGSFRPGRLWLVVLAGLSLVILGGLISAVVNGHDAGDVVRFVVRGAGRFAFLAVIVCAVGLAVSRWPALQRLSAQAMAIVGTIEAVFGVVAYVVPLPNKLGLEAPRKATVLFGEIPGRVSGTLGISPDFTGAILMATVIITVGLALVTSGRLRRLWLLAAVLQLVTLILTFARAPLALALIGVAVVLLLSRRPILLAPIAAIAALAAVLTPLGSRLLSDSNDRLALWTAAVRILRDHPLAGVGPGRMLAAMRAHPGKYMHTEFGRATNNAHNTILLAGAEMGLIAAVGSLLLNLGIASLAMLRIRAARANRLTGPVTVSGSVAILGILVQGMVNNLFTVGATSVVLAFLVGVFLWDPDPEVVAPPAS